MLNKLVELYQRYVHFLHNANSNKHGLMKTRHITLRITVCRKDGFFDWSVVQTRIVVLFAVGKDRLEISGAYATPLSR